MKKAKDKGRQPEAVKENEDTWSRTKLTPLPKNLKKTPDWAEFEKLVGGRIGVKVDPKRIASTAQALGLKQLPPSYVEYVTRFGGILGWQLFHAHDRFPRFLSVEVPEHLRELQKTFSKRLDAVNSDDAEVEVSQGYGTWSLSVVTRREWTLLGTRRFPERGVSSRSAS